MKTPTKFVTTLSDEETNKLIENHQTNLNFRVRNRSHAILLSAEGYAMDEIARVCRVRRETVSFWIDAWGEFGVRGLKDDERAGRPKILTNEEEDKAVEIALRNPRFPARQMSEIVKEVGKEISVFTLKELLKKKIISGKELS